MLDDIEIRARRAAEKLTQQEFADKLNISRTYLGRIETGRVKHVSKRLEARYDRLYNKRLITVHDFVRGVDCPYCTTEKTPEQLSHPDQVEYTIWRCRECNKTFTTAEAWHDVV